MIADLKPYPAMKDSGVEWLGNLPKHWYERRAKYFYREVDERSTTGDEELMSVSHKTGVTPRKQHVTMFMAENNIGHKICRPDDLVINTMWAFMAALGIARQVGVVSPSYGVYRPLRPGKMVPDYMDRLLRIEQYKSQYMRRSTVINSSRLRLYPDEFLRIPIISPPLSEQTAIVRYLDHVDRRVRRLVRSKQKLIGLLAEQKQAIIHRAVTRGLDPDVPLRDSGLPWCPQVPAHWDLKPNRAVLRQRKVLVGERHPEYTLLSLTKQGVIVRDLSENKGKFSSDMGTSQEVHPGDLVMCLFDVPETPRTVGLSKYHGMITGAYTVFEPGDDELGIWLEKFYIAMDDRKLLSPLYSGLRNTIPKPHFLGTKTPIPPAVERESTLSRAEEMTADAGDCIARAKREIELLREYRTRLIADVVTGKLDVREAAANLPDEPDETEPLDETDDLLNGDDEMADDLDAIPEEAEA